MPQSQPGKAEITTNTQRGLKVSLDGKDSLRKYYALILWTRTGVTPTVGHRMHISLLCRAWKVWERYKNRMLSV